MKNYVKWQDQVLNLNRPHENLMSHTKSESVCMLDLVTSSNWKPFSASRDIFWPHLQACRRRDSLGSSAPESQSQTLRSCTHSPPVSTHPLISSSKTRTSAHSLAHHWNQIYRRILLYCSFKSLLRFCLDKERTSNQQIFGHTAKNKVSRKV